MNEGYRPVVNGGQQNPVSGELHVEPIVPFRELKSSAVPKRPVCLHAARELH